MAGWYRETNKSWGSCVSQSCSEVSSRHCIYNCNISVPTILMIASFFFSINWGIVNLQHSVSFKCTAKWFRFFSVIGYYYKILSIVSVLHSRSLFIYFVHSSVNLLIPKLLTCPSSHFPPFLCLWVYFYFITKFTCIIFFRFHKWVISFSCYESNSDRERQLSAGFFLLRQRGNGSWSWSSTWIQTLIFPVPNWLSWASYVSTLLLHLLNGQLIPHAPVCVSVCVCSLSNYNNFKLTAHNYDLVLLLLIKLQSNKLRSI